jgi:hypothetical protein
MSGTDISRTNVKGNCSLKCAYNFNYHPSNSTATNMGTNIKISYESSVMVPVTFNDMKYNVVEVLLFSPSLHTFHGAQVKAELLIVHKQQDMGNELVVCIPIISSNIYTKSSQILTDVINAVASKSPKKGETTALNLGQEFTLQTIVPSKPFISYKDTSVIKGDVIVYETENAIPLSITTLKSLSSIIKPQPLTLPNVELFYNSSGPNQHSIGSSDDIYISCQPTGSSGETIQTEKEKVKNTVQFDYSTILVNPLFIGLFVMFVFIIFLYIVNAVYGYIFVGKAGRTSSSQGTTSSSKK